MELVVASRKLIAKMRRWKSLRRIHITNVPDLTLLDMPKPGIEMKPGMRVRERGGTDHCSFWYGFNDSWLEWCRGESMHDWFQPYVYEILVDESKILRISNEQEFEAFEDEYHGVPEYLEAMYDKEHNGRKYRSIDAPSPYFRSGRYFTSYIDYGRVAEKYGGVEIVPYLWSKRLESIWYYGWDCASGVIWDKGAVTEVRLIGKYDDKTNDFVRVK